MGIQKVQDLLYEDQILTPAQFERRYQIPPRQGLLDNFRRILPREWSDILVPINRHTQENALYITGKSNERINFQSLSTKSIYDLFQTRKKPPYTCDQRWGRIYEDNSFHSPAKWRHWHQLPYKISHSVQIQNFMLRIAYRIIPTRTYLQNIHVIDSDLCRECNLRDDLLHFFFDCVEVKPFWDSLATWIDQSEGVMDFPEDLCEEEFLLGTMVPSPSHYLLNYIIMWAKFYVYKTKVFGDSKLDMFQFLLELKSRLALERLACLADGSYNKRFKRWQSFFDSF